MEEHFIKNQKCFFFKQKKIKQKKNLSCRKFIGWATVDKNKSKKYKYEEKKCNFM